MISQSSGTTSFDFLLKDTAESLGLDQLIREPTRISTNSANLRDLIFTDNSQSVQSSGTLSSFSNLDHFPIFVSLSFTLSTTHTDETKLIWDYSKMDAPLMTRLLIETDWANILNNDIDTAATQFIQAIHDAATASIPTKCIRNRDNQKPWVNADLKRHIRKRERLFKNAKQTNTEYSWSRWRHQRNVVTTTNRRLKKTNTCNKRYTNC